MPSEKLIAAINEQIDRELAAAHQYVAMTAFYESRTFPQLASLFRVQAEEERRHADKLMGYLLDTGATPTLGGVPAPGGGFSDHIEPIRLALELERRNTVEIDKVFDIARETADHASEVFLHWFVSEQVEEEAKMGALLEVAERLRESPMMLEEFVARENMAAAGGDATSGGS